MELIVPVICGVAGAIIAGSLGFGISDIQWWLIGIPWWLLSMMIGYKTN